LAAQQLLLEEKQAQIAAGDIDSGRLRQQLLDTEKAAVAMRDERDGAADDRLKTHNENQLLRTQLELSKELAAAHAAANQDMKIQLEETRDELRQHRTRRPERPNAPTPLLEEEATKAKEQHAATQQIESDRQISEMRASIGQLAEQLAFMIQHTWSGSPRSESMGTPPAPPSTPVANTVGLATPRTAPPAAAASGAEHKEIEVEEVTVQATIQATFTNDIIKKLAEESTSPKTFKQHLKALLVLRAQDTTERSLHFRKKVDNILGEGSKARHIAVDSTEFKNLLVNTSKAMIKKGISLE
jgi:hypothetical protein